MAVAEVRLCRGFLRGAQKCVTPSTTEAEYVAMADGVKGALYVRMLVSGAQSGLAEYWSV